MNNKECLPKNGLALYNKPILLASFFSVYLICSFQDKCSSNKTPRNFIDPTLSTFLSFINNLGSKSGRSSVLLGLWNSYKIINESYFCIRHKTRRKHNQHFETAVFHNKFTLCHIKPNIYI